MNQPLDHAGFSIKGFKEIAGHDDSRPFECSIYYKGKRVCKAWDDGWGGGGSFQWLIKNVEKIWNEHIEKLPPWEYGDRKHKYDSDLFLADIIENHEFLTKIRRLCKNHILMRFPEDGFYTYRKINKKIQFTPEIKNKILGADNIPDGVVFWNELITQ